MKLITVLGRHPSDLIMTFDRNRFIWMNYQIAYNEFDVTIFLEGDVKLYTHLTRIAFDDLILTIGKE